MNHKQNNEKPVSAIAFMRSFDETMNLMEAIGDNTAKEQKVLTESAVHMESYTDEEGVFNMDGLLDVDVSDTEENQPRMYNSPEEELTDGDKQLIVDEFAEQLSNMHEEVIDFSDVGPIATVIQDKFGFKQNLDEFLTGLMTSAADNQDSQAFAHGKPIPGVAATEVDGPTDIAPPQAGPGGVGGDVDLMASPSMDVPMDTPMDTPMDVPMDVPMDTEEGLEVDVAEIADMEVPDVGLEELPVEDEVSPEAPIGEESEVLGPEEDEDEDEDDDSLELQFEAIRSKHLGLNAFIEGIIKKDLAVDAQLEAIKNNLFENEYASTQDEDGFNKNAEKAESSAQSGAEEMRDDSLDTPATEDRDDTAKMEYANPVLESIAAEYHAKENAKIEKVQAKLEAIQAEKKLDVKLESIAGAYHAGVQAKVEAINAESKLDEKLSTLVESYHTQAKIINTETKANIEARKQAKAKLNTLSK